MVIHEVFWSVQGEGLRSGSPTIFIRTAGCTLQCPYCDTRDAWSTGIRIGIPALIRKVDHLRKSYPRSQVVITGGEPLEQDLGELVAQLREKQVFVSIETNGIYVQSLDIDWWTVSPKDVADFFVAAELKRKISEMKLIVNKNLTVPVVKKLRAIKEDFPIFLQPDFFDRDRNRNTFSLFSECQKEGIPNLRLGIQMHRVVDVK
jgi:7-carboxy-7-deazaguanine synthase